MRISMPDGSIRFTQGKAPLPVGGTFSANGYGLDKPSPVVSYVMRPLRNPRPQYVPQVCMPGMTTITTAHNNPRVPHLGDVIEAEERVKKERTTSLALLSVGAALVIGAVWLSGKH